VSQYPIVTFVFPTDATPAGVRGMILAMRRFAAELKEPIVLLVDISGVRAVDPDSRTIHVEFVRDMREVSGHLVRGVAVITRSAFQRALLNLHSLLVGKTPYPVRGFSERSNAIPWLNGRLGSSGFRLESSG
jgi:hypothetical protein